MRSLTALSAFLDVSSLNLAAPQASPFFSAVSCWSGLAQEACGLREASDQAGDPVPHRYEAGQPLDSALIHVKLARDLDLQRMDALTRAAIVAGDIATGVGVIASHAVAQ